MARSLDEIFGTQPQKKRTLDEIFNPEPAPAPNLSMQGLREINNNITDTIRVPGVNHDLMPNEDINFVVKHPDFVNAAYTLSTPIRNFMNLPFNQRASQAGAEVATGQKFDTPAPSTGSKALDLGADVLGGIMGFASNPGGAPNIGSSLFNLGENAIQKPLAKVALPQIAKTGIGLGAGSVAYDAGTSLANGDNISPKDIGLAAVENAALGLIPYGIGKGLELRTDAKINKQVNSLIPELQGNALQDVQNAYKAPSLRDVQQQDYANLFSGPDTIFQPQTIKADNPSQYFGTTQADVQAAFPPRKIKQYSFTTGEQRALDELNQGIQTAQNYIGHNDVLAAYPPGTTIQQAYADIKANTGVDLPRLYDNYVAASNRKTSLTPKELRLGRAAGVIPDLKPRDILSPETPAIPKIEPQQNILEPRIWTNKDNIPPAGPGPIKSITEENLGQLTGATQIKNEPKLQVASSKIDTPKPIPEVSGKTIPNPTHIKDIGNFKAYTSDVYRIFSDVFGKEAGDSLLRNFDEAKASNIDMQTNLVNRLKNEVINGLGIKKGSKESKLVMNYGEGKITLEELQRQSPDKWQNIVKADQWFRNEYDNLIEQINAVKKQIYPNAEANIAKVDAQIADVKADKTLSPTERNDLLKQLNSKREEVMRGKLIPHRQDYYRHFQELADGIQGLKNIFDSPANISTSLIGTSEFTKPKSKWESFAQKRLGDKTVEDAVGGFLNYIPAASYAVHIDPQIAWFRNLEKYIKDTTAETHNADTFIGFLDKYASDLAGKTNPADRFIQDIIPGGRKTFQVLNWLNNRVKANVVLGKASSAVAQLANIPSGIAFAKQYSLEGLARSMSSIFKESKPMQESKFLKERFGGQHGNLYSQFDHGIIKDAKKAAVWLMETSDKVGTTFIWNSAYAKGLGQHVADPIRYADNVTRNLVAGRGIGEVPLIQKSKLFQLVAPFQLEVANLWHVQKDFIKAKDFGGLIALYLLNYGFNNAMQQINGNRVVFDPINAIKQAATEKDITPLQRVGRVAGEFFSNIPLGQTAAAIYPDNGIGNWPSRKQFFGSNDPTRFGSGLLATKGIQDPLYKVILPFGGDQLKKTIQGIQDLQNGGHISNGKLSYPISNTLPNKIKLPLFGPSASSEAQDYYNNNRRPLSEQQTQQVLKSPDPITAYNKLMLQRSLSTLDEEIKAAKNNKALTDDKRQKLIQDLIARKEQLNKK